MVDRSETQACTQLCEEILESCAVELLAIVFYDLLRDAEATDDVLAKELLQGSGGDVPECLGFDPFGEILNCDCSVFVVS